jgi:hypothetical protein
LSIGALLVLSASGTLAQDISVTINGSPVSFQDIGPQEIQGRVLVPVRGVLEKLGANVAWVPQTHSVVASNAQIDIELKIGDRRATVNSQTVMLDVPAQILAGHTMVPLRFLGEALGAKVGWNGQTHTVMILTQNQPPPPPDHLPHHDHSGPTPTINAFSDNATGWLRAGATLRVVLEGTPGGQAAFRIPGVVEEMPMRESAPGRYFGVWQVPENSPIQISDAAVIGSLRIGDRAAPLIQAANTVSVDALPPHIRDRAPDPDSLVTTARPTIYAVFDDRGSGINNRSIRVLLNGHDVTPEATVTRDFVSFTPARPLPYGPQIVQVIASDNAGNTVQDTWKFIAASNEAARIQSVACSPNRPLEPGERLHVEMVGAPGGRAAFSVGNIKGIALQETSAGHYVADYTIRKGDDTNGSRLATRLVTPDGQAFVGQSSQIVTVRTGQPMEPVVTQPGPGAPPSNPLVVQGKGTPNTRVHVKVDYRNQLLGVLAVQGTAADRIVDVDRNGNWQTDPINLSSLFSNRDMQYMISVTAINAANQTSATRQIPFRLR